MSTKLINNFKEDSFGGGAAVRSVFFDFPSGKPQVSKKTLSVTAEEENLSSLIFQAENRQFQRRHGLKKTPIQSPMGSGKKKAAGRFARRLGVT
jgi:hypothetical protein